MSEGRFSNRICGNGARARSPGRARRSLSTHRKRKGLIMATTRSAHTVWEGGLLNGGGIATFDSSGIADQPVSWPSRAEQADGKTSPEELIAAAHSSCFAMALTHGLEGAGTAPSRALSPASTKMRSSPRRRTPRPTARSAEHSRERRSRSRPSSSEPERTSLRAPRAARVRGAPLFRMPSAPGRRRGSAQVRDAADGLRLTCSSDYQPRSHTEKYLAFG
jgi:organic hydroperoxide reductase OsmC/OhrA